MTPTIVLKDQATPLSHTLLAQLSPLHRLAPQAERNPALKMASPAGSTPTGSGSFIEPEREDLLRNSTDESVPWVVQKYGGTSVGKSLDSICAIVA